MMYDDEDLPPAREGLVYLPTESEKIDMVCDEGKIHLILDCAGAKRLASETAWGAEWLPWREELSYYKSAQHITVDRASRSGFFEITVLGKKAKRGPPKVPKCGPLSTRMDLYLYRPELLMVSKNVFMLIDNPATPITMEVLDGFLVTKDCSDSNWAPYDENA